MKKSVAGLCLLIFGSFLVTVTPVAAQARGVFSKCAGGHWRVTTTKGAPVWLPSSYFVGPFQWGGTQSLSVADGKMHATTKGSADTIEASGGVNIEVYQASLKYSHQWNRSTTDTTSITRTFTTTSHLQPNNLNFRWRLYMRGFRFKVTKVCTALPPFYPWCARHNWCRVVRWIYAPVRRPALSFHIETYGKRNWILGIHGAPRWPHP